MYADKTTICFIVSIITDKACCLLNNALEELNKWCMNNSIKPHPAKCEAMLFYRGYFISDETITSGCHSRLLGVICLVPRRVVADFG